MHKFRHISARVTAAMLSAALFGLCLAGCRSENDEKLSVSTELTLSSSFSGSRTIHAHFPSELAPGTSGGEQLETLLRKYCPSQLSYSSDGNSDYTFTVEFSSYSDYISKLTEITGSRPVVVFAAPSTPLTSGWRIEEYFTSANLLEWLKTAARAEQFGGFDYSSEEKETTLNYSGESFSTLPTISVNKLSGYPVSHIDIQTVNKDSLIDRTVEFHIPQSTFDALGNDLSAYFASVTDKSAESEWQLENNEYIYTVRFTSVAPKQLEGCMNKLMSSVYGDVSYTDKTSGSTPIAYQNSYTETVDLSAYTAEGNSNVPVNFTYSVDGRSDLSEPLMYSDTDWISASDELTVGETEDKKGIVISGTAPAMTLRFTDGKEYIPAYVAIKLTPLDGDNLKKEYSFAYDAEQGGEAAEYTASYFKGIGIASDRTAVDGKSFCTISFTGTPAQLNAGITDIFGDRNLMTFTSFTPAMTLRTTKRYEDQVDLSGLLVGKSEDTPVYYSISPREGELADSLTLEANDETKSISPDEKGNYKATLSASGGFICSEVSVLNWSDMIIFIAMSVILVLAAAAGIFVMKMKTASQPALEQGDGRHEALPAPEKPATKMTATKRKKGDPEK